MYNLTTPINGNGPMEESPALFQLGGDKLIDPKIVNTVYKVPCIFMDIILLRSIEKNHEQLT